MRTFAKALLPALLVALSACADTPAERFAQAQAAYAREDFQGARVALVAALRELPGDRAMLTLLARTQLRLGDADGAGQTIALLARKPGDATVLARLDAERLLLLGRGREALDRLAPEDRSSEAWRLRAAAWLVLGEEDRARNAFGQGMAAGSDLRLASDYARYLLQAGKLDAVAKVLAAMRRFAPDAYETIVLEGDLAVASGRSEAATAAFERAVERYPERHEPLLALANQRDEEGKVREAMALADRAEAIAGDRPEIFALQIQLLGELGEWEKVRSALQGRESTIDPASGVGLTYGEALLRLGHPEQARALFRRALLLLPGNPYSRLMLGEAQLATKDADAAWRTLEPLSRSVLAPPEVIDAAARAAEAVQVPEAAVLRARLEPARIKRHTAQVARAQAMFDRQDWAGVLAAYQAIPGAEEDPDVLMRLALASSRLGRHAEAIGYADRALARDPQSAEGAHMAGVVRLAAGDPEASIYLQRAVEADPRNDRFRRALERSQRDL